jgi:tetratricopeptide (TPR) repeat protein
MLEVRGSSVRSEPSPPPRSAQRLLRLRLGKAVEHKRAGRFYAAEAIISQILGEFPEQPAASHLLGLIRFQQGRAAEAAALMERSIAHSAATAAYHYNICEVYRVLGRYDEALAAGRRAVSSTPEDPDCHADLGITHYYRLALDQAIDCAAHAIALDANFAGAHFGLAEALLLSGQFEQGWEEYEWRYKIDNAPPQLPPTDRPQWDGRPLREGTLILITDQGDGDVIQFSRYIPWAAKRCARIALACRPGLCAMMRQLPDIEVIFDRWADRPEFAAYLPLSGLPRLARTRLDTIATPIPYPRGDPDKASHWARRLHRMVPAGHRRIGVAWAGNPNHPNDRNRSVALAALAPLSRLSRVALLSVQKGPGADQIGTCRWTTPPIDLGPEIADYSDAMAIIENLDLVLTVDTSVAHLAGAMGKPVWIMLPFAPDWRWLLDRSDSPWYPSARLFRQPAPCAWEAVISQVVTALERSE